MLPVTEEELISKAVAPRVTKEGLEANIKAYYAFNVLSALQALNATDPDNEMPLVPELGVLTLSVLVLENGFTVVGQSACADPANYNADIGNRLAIEDAKRAIWPLMGYHLKQELYLSGGGTFVDRMEREAKELEDKLTKLQVFVSTETFNKLSEKEKELLITQKEAMAEYHEVLTERLSLKKT